MCRPTPFHIKNAAIAYNTVKRVKKKAWKTCHRKACFVAFDTLLTINNLSDRHASLLKQIVIPQRKILECDWSKLHHVTFINTP